MTLDSDWSSVEWVGRSMSSSSEQRVINHVITGKPLLRTAQLNLPKRELKEESRTLRVRSNKLGFDGYL